MWTTKNMDIENIYDLKNDKFQSLFHFHFIDLVVDQKQLQ